jgi:hypothetical protein
MIATMLRLVCPLVFNHPLVLTLRAWMRVVLRLGLSLGLAMGVYGLALLVVLEAYPCARKLAVLVYCVALAGATLLGTCTGVLAAPRGLQRLMVPAASGLLLVLPVALYVHAMVVGAWSPLYVSYVLGGVAGGLTAMHLLHTESLELHHRV